MNKRLETQHVSAKEIYNELIGIKNRAVLSDQHACNARNNKIIYSEELRKSRQKYRFTVNRYKNLNSQENLLALLVAKREYNKKLKSEIRENKLNEKKLKEAKIDNDGKRYWQLINENKRKTKRKQSHLEAKDFKTQLENRDIEMTERFLSTNISNGYIPTSSKQTLDEELLNMNITVEEITKNLKTMSNAKSSGPDGLVYDILKNNFQETTLLLKKMFDSIQNSDKNIHLEKSLATPESFR